MSVKLNESYDDKTLLSEYYPIVKDNQKKLAEEINGHEAAAVIDHPDGSVTETKLADGSVSNRKLAPDSVSLDKLDDEVTEYFATAAAEEKADERIGKLESQAGTEYIGPNTITGLLNIHEDSIVDLEQGLKDKADKTQYASTTEYGLVKLSPKGGIIHSDGLTVNTNNNYGTGRTGDGKVIISAATEEDIDDGTNAYKPITPATFARFINYSTSPQRVGTWFDGTPIWRMAIERNLTAEEKSGGWVQFADAIPTKNLIGGTGGVPLGGYAHVTYSDNGLSEGVVLREFEPFYFTSDGNSLADYEQVIGWVEFATDADNLTL